MLGIISTHFKCVHLCNISGKFGGWDYSSEWCTTFILIKESVDSIRRGNADA